MAKRPSTPGGVKQARKPVTRRVRAMLTGHEPLVRVGFDEAGLGPTLGPLCVAGLATRVDGDPCTEWGALADLHALLASVVGPPGSRDGRLEVGDSKQIHTGPRKLERIERTALATIGWVYGRVPANVSELLALVTVDAFEHPEDRRAPWWSMLDEGLPISNSREAVETAAASLTAAAKRAGITPLWYAADLVGAARVNRELDAESVREGGSKNTWATHAVLRLARLAVGHLDTSEARSLAIWCDKAGGRQAYREPLLRAFVELVEVEHVFEQRERSHYRMHVDGRRVELGFVMGGDSVDPRISWGSILAKYLRELVLRALNRYFVERIPNLRPTAGYPEDAARFIQNVEAALGPDGGLERAAWIRCK
jgi:ribonuclease HII